MKTNDSIKDLLELLGYPSLYPPQQQAISHGLLEGKNLLITTPTASGKTLIAIMASIKAFEEGKKVICLTPLRALALEKYHDFSIIKRLNGPSNVNIKIASSDYTYGPTRLGQADVLILTNEKMDSLIRRDTSWISDVGLFIVDEIHLIGDQDRGPTLEMLLAIIRKIHPRAQLLALSATISNSVEIADWLGCELVDTKWRPTQLLEGVYEGGTTSVRMNDGDQIKIPGFSNAAIDIAVDSIRKGGQSLIFAPTRKRAYSLALKAAEVVSKVLNKTDKEKAFKMCRQIRTKGEDIELIANLSEIVSKGVAFHHAGLGSSAREIVEQAFKHGIVKLLVATPTLAAGVNLPARRVVISGVLRYDSDSGTNLPISVLEYKQLCGRAGRPMYDNIGEAIIVGESGLNSRELYEHYVLGEPEPIRSGLMKERALRIYTLSIISTIPGMKLEEIHVLFGKTLCGQQHKETIMARKIDSTLRYLEAENLIKSKSDRYIPTNFGRKTSLLYIDPLTAVEFKRAICMSNQFEPISENRVTTHTLAFLHLISCCPDFYPKLPMRKRDFELIPTYENPRNEICDFEYTRSLLALYEWIHEASDRSLNDRLSIEPGDMHRMVENADWLARALYQVAKLLGRGDLLKELSELQIRIRFGIKEELVSLVKLKGVGRVRARALYEAGFSDLKKIADAPETRLSSVSKVGPNLAKKLKAQLNKEPV